MAASLSPAAPVFTRPLHSCPLLRHIAVTQQLMLRELFLAVCQTQWKPPPLPPPWVLCALPLQEHKPVSSR